MKAQDEKVSTAYGRRLGYFGSMFLLGCAQLAIVPAADARVTKIEIVSKQSPTFGGLSFGSVGTYEKIFARAYGEVELGNRHRPVRIYTAVERVRHDHIGRRTGVGSIERRQHAAHRPTLPRRRDSYNSDIGTNPARMTRLFPVRVGVTPARAGNASRPPIISSMPTGLHRPVAISLSSTGRSVAKSAAPIRSRAPGFASRVRRRSTGGSRVSRSSASRINRRSSAMAASRSISRISKASASCSSMMAGLAKAMRGTRARCRRSTKSAGLGLSS